MKSLLLLACVGVLLVQPREVRAQDAYKVVVNSANPVNALSAADASKLFLRKQAKWPSGQPALPVDQGESSPVRKAFTKAVHGMDVPSVSSYWQELVFSGKGEPPAQKPSDAEVIAYIKANPSAVGYVGPSAAGLGDVKVVTLTP